MIDFLSNYFNNNDKLIIIVSVGLGLISVLILYKIIMRSRAKSPILPNSESKISENTINNAAQETVEKPVIKQPVKETVEKPVIKQPAKETVEKPVIKQPVKETVEKPVTKQPIKETVEKPVSKQPVKETVEKPVSKQPVKETVEKIIIPKNPKTIFVDAGKEDQDKVKYIGYEPSVLFEQREPYSYPIVIMPKSKSVIKFPRKGKQGLSGFTEASFKVHLLKYFAQIFQIFDDRFVLYKSNQNPYEPDFTFIDEKNGVNLFIDIEIDEPYEGVSKQPIHYTGFDNQRNTFFSNRGWIVIRFAEYQIVKESLGCCKFVAEVVKSVNSNFEIPVLLQNVQELAPIKQWTKEQSLNWALEKYREKYLGIDIFTVQEREIILGNLTETQLGEQIEQLVQEEPIDSNTYKIELINKAITFNNYISCKFNSGTNYTVIKPIKLVGTKLIGYCYLKNKEIEYDINDIGNFIVRAKPFIFRLNGEIGVSQITTFVHKYISSLHPIRIKYTKGAWSELIVDEQTGEVILNQIESEQSLRTITSFNLPSKVLPAQKIAQYNLNDTNYIAGYCHLRNELRTFRFNRINEIEILNI